MNAGCATRRYGQFQRSVSVGSEVGVVGLSIPEYGDASTATGG